MISRRAQGISLNVIVIAAIALLVLVILTALVIGGGRNVNRGVNVCENLGTPGVDYRCVDTSLGDESCGTYDMIRHVGRVCEQEDFEGNPMTCCIPV